MSTTDTPSELDHLLRQKFWPEAIYDFAPVSVETRGQKRVRQMCDSIRAKPNWIEKLKDVKICARWLIIAKYRGLTNPERDYAFEKLDYFASLHTPGSNIYMSPVEQVWISDSLIDPETEVQLKECETILEDVPDTKKDWHLNSNNQVLNLIDPSLFPLIYACSHILITPIPSPIAALSLSTFGQTPGNHDAWREFLKEHYSSADDVDSSVYFMPEKPVRQQGNHSIKPENKFCWLPTEFDVADNGETTIKSYINNLHPVKHAAFYPIIASIFSKFVPLLEHVLTDIAHPRPMYIIDQAEHELYMRSYPDSEDDVDFIYKDWVRSYRHLEQNPLPFEAPDRPKVPYSLRGRRLQAIVKMSNIFLTPKNRKYEGDTWHVEALENERIIATGIYYYDIDNVTEGNLAFRESVDTETIKYLQNRDDMISIDYDIFDGTDVYNRVKVSQLIGQVEIRNGRCIVFPNIYQHRVSGFKLANRKKPGHCKILTFFFIDPSTKIPSTEIVPPQQKEWWCETVTKAGRFAELPIIIKENIFERVDFPISIKHAKSIRLELMEEHKPAEDDNAIKGFEPYFTYSEN
ncbi:hypothetical protein GGI05_002754 [Coemansia sp. RSA 2603]|nr:hypothetical protein GGI05_002754 [Coemansia sp. RSA 2603]